jgi:hypothetical protein
MTDRRNLRRTFRGQDSGRAGLTWGQLYIWHALRELRASPHYLNLVRLIALPPAVTADKVADATVALIERHESLRTRFLTDPSGQPVQQVDADGTVDLELREAGEGGAAILADEVFTEHFCHVFDLERGLPLRLTIITELGRPRLLMMSMTHMAADRWGMEVAARDLLTLLAEGGGRSAGDGVAPRGLEPRAQAAVQRGPVGQRRNTGAMRWWRTQLLTVPPAMFTCRTDQPSSTWMRAAELRSKAAALAVDTLAARWETSPSRVVLAAVATALRLSTGHTTVAMRLLVGNRFDPATRETVSTQVQTGLFVVEPSEDSFAETVRRTEAAALRAYRFSSYVAGDLEQTVRVVSRERSAPVELDCYFQDGTTRGDQEDGEPVGRTDPAQVREALAASAFRWHLNWMPWRRFSWFMRRDRGTVMLQLTADPAYVSPDLSEAMVRGVETMLVGAVDGDLGLAEISARTGLRASAAQEGPRAPSLVRDAAQPDIHEGDSHA